jgi:hypothetical protein
MKTLSIGTHRGYVRQVDEKDRWLHMTPKNMGECIALAKEATERSRWKDESAKGLWLVVINEASRLRLDLRTIVESRLPDGRFLLEACIESQNWDLCLEFIFALPEGKYCNERVIRNHKTLVLNENGPEKQKGVLATEDGHYYGGDLKFWKKNGKGILKSWGDNIFEGTFENDLRNGLGRYKEGNKITQEGLFIAGKWVGNSHKLPHPSSKVPSMGKFFNW